MKKITLLTCLLATALIVSCSKNLSEDSSSDSDNLSAISKSKGGVIPNSYIVVFNSTAVEKSSGLTKVSMTNKVNNLLARHHIKTSKVKFIYERVLLGFAIELSQTEYLNLSQDADVDFIEQDQVFNYATEKRLPISSTQKGKGILNQPEITPANVTRVGGGMNTSIFGNNKKAWIIDSGLDLDHPDLNVDVSLSISFDPLVTSPDDNDGHGTEVAGVLGAKLNGIGTVGVYPGVSMVAVKAGDQSAPVSGIIAAVNYVAANASPIDVVNMSLGDPVPHSNSIDAAVTALAATGVKVIAAAGNKYLDANNYSPAGVNVPNFYTVSAMDDFDVFSPFSNWGSSIDYCAPSTNIYTTVVGGGYATLAGGSTSLAAPHVSGVMLYPQTTVLNPSYVIGDPDGVPDEIIQVGIQR